MGYCKGCGALLQSEDKNKTGYTPKINNEYCQRCFRIIHYDDLTISMRKGIDADTVIHQIEDMDALILWVVDLFDFEASIIPGLNRKITEKDIIMVATKRDLFPNSIQNDKLAQFVFDRLEEYGILINELVITSKDDKQGLKDIEQAIAYYQKNNEKEIVVIGRANAGKSTLLNSLMKENILTASKYPGTTLDLNRIEYNGYTFIDTPGIEIENSILMCTKESDLKLILPQRRIKPKVFQLKGDQSFALGGLCRIDLFDCDNASIVFYLSDEIKIHRSKVDNAEDNWTKHYGELYIPIPIYDEKNKRIIKKECDEMDIVVNGLGFMSVHGNIKKIEVSVPKGVDITIRKAMI